MKSERLHAEGGRTRSIALVRHGRSEHVQTGWIDFDGFRAWRERYESAGIRKDEIIPDDLRKLAGGATRFASSDARRAVESAALLAKGREVIVSSLLRELELPALPLAGLRLPLIGWAVTVGLQSLRSTSRKSESAVQEMERIRSAAHWLGELAADEELVIAVTHASFRKRLARELEGNGWVGEARTSALRHWSVWTYRR
jgi:broad specificity phosphatase PhoE